MAPPAKRRKTSNIEEISFDDSAREEYLTGFHKRKLQRIKHAQEVAAKKEREEKINERKQMRQQRKEDLEKHVETVNAMLRSAQADTDGGDATEDDGVDGAQEEWVGFEGSAEVNREDEYVDEDLYTTVTVEAVDVSKNGLHLAESEVVKENDEKQGSRSGDKQVANGNGAVLNGQTAKKQAWTKENPAKDKAKKKKKKFRYESKTERKASRDKQKLKNRAAAKARRGD